MIDNNNKKIVKKKDSERLIGTPEAMEIVRTVGRITITLPTLIAWVRKHSLGRQIGRRWYIDKELLKRHLKGDLLL